MRPMLLRSAPFLLAGLGILLYPQLVQHAQDGRSRPGAAADTVMYQVLLGVGDTEPTNWDGGLKLTGGTITSIQGMRFAQKDSTDGKTSWRASTRRAVPQNPAQRLAGQGGLMTDNGVDIS